MSKHENLSEKVLSINDFSVYLPASGYEQKIPAGMEYAAYWKEHADKITTPAVIAEIYKSLYEMGVIPEYSRQKPFVLVSYGSNIPTYERLFFDLDTQKREARTHIVAVDKLPIPETILSQLIVNPNNQEQINSGKIQSSFTFVQGDEETRSVGLGKADVIMNFRASLYYDLKPLFYDPKNEHGYRKGELIDNAKKTLKKYYNELNETGAVVVDGQTDEKVLVATTMVISTGDLLVKFRKDLGIDELFELEFIGEGKSKVLVLKKRVKS